MTRIALWQLCLATALFTTSLQIPSALANDSSVELSVGGLVFTRNADVSMESEDLTITLENVTVRYRFLNQSQKPVSLTVAFPLPDIDLSDGALNYAIPTTDPVNFVGFQTQVDGQAVKLDIRQRAVLGEKDVTSDVAGAGLALLPVGVYENEINQLSAATKKRLLDQGLIVAAGSDEKGQPLYDAGWTVKTTVVRQQTFPPGRPVLVEHRFRTSVGMSFDTILRKSLRENKAMDAELKRYRASYCVEDSFLRGVDKMAGDAEANTARLQERRISYVLKTGANWLGPIKDFRLVVDKGRPDRLLSFCGENIKRMSATTFEVRARDFTPQRDLKILIIGKPD